MITDQLSRLGVEQQDGPVPLADRERLSVGAEGARAWLAADVQDAERRGAAQEGREEVRVGLDRVVEGDARVGETQRVAEAICVERFCAEALGVGNAGRGAGALAL